MTQPSTSETAGFDVAVIGAGAAGLYTALIAAEEGARVVLVSRSPVAQSASFWAQGGLAAAITADDSAELHLQDTIAAGRGATAASRAEILCEEAPDRLRELVGRGVRFDTDADGKLLLGLEGGHSRRRIVHAGGSSTGRYLTARLSELVTERRPDRGARALLGFAALDRRRPLRRPDQRPRPDRGARDRARHRRRRRALAANHQPARLGRLGPAAGARRRRHAGRSRVRPVPPDRRGDQRRAGRLPDHRGGARRGRSAEGRRRRALRRRARAARRGRARDRRAAAGERQRPRPARHARRRSDAVPQHLRTARRRRPRRDPRA